MNRFHNKVYLLTGGARGMGAAQARRLVAEGARVLLADVLVDQGQALAQELGAAAVFAALDVGDEGQWQQAVVAAERLGPLSGLVNNAGIFEPLSIQDTDAAAFERHVRVNQLGTFLGMRATLAAFERNGGGSIVNISSTAGLRGIPNALAYTATKWAVRGMTKAAAQELADKNIRVNSVHPGLIDTDMLRVRDNALKQRLASNQPIKRLGTADEIASLVLFLLSDESQFMTGAELTKDGGRSL